MLSGLAIFLVSAAAVADEILLMRLLSIIQWHHFAAMIISLALLGYGASGTAIGLLEQRLPKRPETAMAACCLLLSFGMPAAFLTAQRIPFNPLELFWDPLQVPYLLAIYLCLSVPFTAAGGVIGLAFHSKPGRATWIYAWDLAGAAAGALGCVFLLRHLDPPGCLLAIAPAGLLAAACLGLSGSARGWKILAALSFLLAILTGAAGLGRFQDASILRLSPYKALARALQRPEARILNERSGPEAWLAVVASPVIPFRYGTGLSLRCQAEIPRQLGLFTDGDGSAPITRFDGNPASLAHLDCMTGALPYQLLEHPKVLLAGLGGGDRVLRAVRHRAAAVEVVEPNRERVELIRTDYREFAGGILQRPGTKVHVTTFRRFLAETDGRFDLIELDGMESASGSASGVGAVAADYRHTVEAVQAGLNRLGPQGILAATCRLQLPPRASVKLTATVLEAMRRQGERHPERRLVLIRSWQTCTLLVKNGAFTAREIRLAEAFCRRWSFDVCYFPGIREEQANRYNRLPSPLLYRAARSLLRADRETFYHRYKFQVRPATDDRPYFACFFKWNSLREILSLPGQGGIALLERGYPVLVITLILALVSSVVLIALPVWFRRGARLPPGGRMRVFAYFGCLGLAFLSVEMAWIQRFTLYLGYPVYAVALVLAVFLFFAGLGSRCSEWLRAHAAFKNRPFGGRFIALVTTLGAILVLAGNFFIPIVIRSGLDWSGPVRGLAAAITLAPMAFFMGMPFPLGIQALAKLGRNTVAWAWAINGCASVVSSLLATLLSIHLGIRTVVVLAAALYLAAGAASWPMEGGACGEDQTIATERRRARGKERSTKS